MNIQRLLAALAALTCWSCHVPVIAADRLVFEAHENNNPKHIVLISGDEEYRSEETMPMLGKILSQRHGFLCTVLFAWGPDQADYIDPNNAQGLRGLDALDTADLLIIGTRFRTPDAEVAKHLTDYLNAGKPVIGLRTATHAFRGEGDFGGLKYDDFGLKILGETWVAHHGQHKVQGARGVSLQGQVSHPILNSVSDVFCPSDVYTVSHLTEADQILMRAAVTESLDPNSPMITGKKNSPTQAFAWLHTYQRPDGSGAGTSFCTTGGASVDFVNEDLRRMVVNAAYFLTDRSVPKQADVTYVDAYYPSFYGTIREPADYWKQLARTAEDFGLGKSPHAEDPPGSPEWEFRDRPSADRQTDAEQAATKQDDSDSKAMKKGDAAATDGDSPDAPDGKPTDKKADEKKADEKEPADEKPARSEAEPAAAEDSAADDAATDDAATDDSVTDDASQSRWQPRSGERIAIVGNSLAERMNLFGFFETLLHTRFPQQQLVFRNFGWPADEVGQQQRPDNYTTIDDPLKVFGPETFICFFGFNEHFMGADEPQLQQFKERYRKWIAEQESMFAKPDREVRFVLVSPIAFEQTDNPLLPDGESNNATLAKYATAVKDLAEELNWPYIDLFTPSQEAFAKEAGAQFTINGVHTNAQGDRLVSAALAQQLFTSTHPLGMDVTPFDRIREAVNDKSWYHLQDYRMLNGWYVYGGRRTWDTETFPGESEDSQDG